MRLGPSGLTLQTNKRIDKVRECVIIYDPFYIKSWGELEDLLKMQVQSLRSYRNQNKKLKQENRELRRRLPQITTERNIT